MTNLISDWRYVMFSIIFFIIAGILFYISVKEFINKNESELPTGCAVFGFCMATFGVIFFFQGFTK